MESVKDHSYVEQIKNSPVLLIVRLFLFLFLVDAIYTVGEIFLLGANVAPKVSQFLVFIMYLTHFLKNVFTIYVVLNVVMKWVGETFYLTDRFLVRKTGLINVKEAVYDLTHIKSISVEQGFLGRLFNYGNILITTSASGGYNDKIHLAEIESPEVYKEKFQRCLELKVDNEKQYGDDNVYLPDASGCSIS